MRRVAQRAFHSFHLTSETILLLDVEWCMPDLRVALQNKAGLLTTQKDS
jgi:hypothetical protein